DRARGVARFPSTGRVVWRGFPRPGASSGGRSPRQGDVLGEGAAGPITSYVSRAGADRHTARSVGWIDRHTVRSVDEGLAIPRARWVDRSPYDALGGRGARHPTRSVGGLIAIRRARWVD